jgi:hypothetical protein
MSVESNLLPPSKLSHGRVGTIAANVHRAASDERFDQRWFSYAAG